MCSLASACGACRTALATIHIWFKRLQHTLAIVASANQLIVDSWNAKSDLAPWRAVVGRLFWQAFCADAAGTALLSVSKGAASVETHFSPNLSVLGRWCSCRANIFLACE